MSTRFTEMVDTDIKYNAINDKVSREAVASTIFGDEQLQKSDRTITDINLYGDDAADREEKYYRQNKENATESLKRVEAILGRDLTDEEMVKVYDLFDITSVGYYKYDAANGDNDTKESLDRYDLRDADLFKNTIYTIAAAIQSDDLDELYSRAFKDTDPDDPQRYKYTFYKQWTAKELPKIYQEILSDKYGDGEIKEEDIIPPEEQELSDADKRDIEDFERIFKDSQD